MDRPTNRQKTNDMSNVTPTKEEMDYKKRLDLACKVDKIKDEIQQVQDSIDFDQQENLWNDVSDIKQDLIRLLEKLCDVCPLN